LAQTEAAKVGLTLTAATLTLFMDLVYTPADHFQAEDRCYRIGQDQEVKIEYLLCRGTVEDHLQELHNAKKSVIAKIFDEDISDSEDVLTVDVRKELLTRLRGEARHSKKQSTGELNFLEVQNNAA
jgi:SNF2 family DNA or RNA helicase